MYVMLISQLVAQLTTQMVLIKIIMYVCKYMYIIYMLYGMVVITVYTDALIKYYNVAVFKKKKKKMAKIVDIHSTVGLL